MSRGAPRNPFWACALCFSLSSAARAELGEDVTRLTAAWREYGVVRRLPPRLSERTAPSIVFLPLELISDRSASCISVAVLGPTSIHFTLRAVGGAHPAESVQEWAQASLAGLIQITRCGARKAQLAALLIEMRSPRAVLEVVAVESRAPIPPSTDILQQRDPGPIAPLMGPGLPKAAAPIAERLASAEVASRAAGGLDVQRDWVQSNANGTGSVRRLTEAGCHHLQVMTEAGSHFSDLVLIPELSAAAGLVAVERGDGYTASLSFCAGARTPIGFRFAGAPGGSRVWIVASRVPLPGGLPDSWDSGGRARMAALLSRDRVKVDGLPVDQALGVQGSTLMPIAIEPGACYVAALSAMQGQAFSLALGVTQGSSNAQNRGGPGAKGTLVSFCSRGESQVLIEAEARGSSLTWLFALWQTGRLSLGEELAQ